jgi:ERF superfamily
MNDTRDEGEDFKPGPLTWVPAPGPAEHFASLLMTMLANPDIPADKMEVVMKMRREVLTDQAREAFIEHFAALSAELPQVERDGTVELMKDGRSMGKYAFTTIENMDTILRPLLAKHGFAISFGSIDNKDSVTITGTLSGWGWERSSTYTLPPDNGPGRNAMQARGSSRRYAKRYITDDLVNIVRKGKDDDARGAMEALIDATQVKKLDELIKATATIEANFLSTMVSGAESLQDIRQRDFPRLLMALQEKRQKMMKKGERSNDGKG